ncbi:MAG: DNA translocase FtsK 4TM domain-containing protein, partial [Pseudomonadota bacterium]
MNKLKNKSVKQTGSNAAGTGLPQRLLREGALIGSALMGLFLLMALVSYSPGDPGFTTTGDGGRVENLVGHMGAWLADVLLHLFGYFAYLFPLALGLKLISLFRDRDDGKDDESAVTLWMLKITGTLLFAIGGCALATLHFALPDSITWPAGGYIGEIMADTALPILALPGSTLLFLAVFLFGMTITFDISWMRVIDRTGYWTLWLWEEGVSRLDRWRDQYREKRESRRVVEKRRQNLTRHVEKQKKRKPPRIEPTLPSIPAGERVQKEKQGTLFEPSVTEGLPAIGLLDGRKGNREKGYSEESLEAMSRLLELKLKDFGIEVEVTAVNPGPVITRFEVQPAPGVKASRITALGRDLARSLAVVSVRVVEVIPGKTVIGIEIPNEQREMILLSEVLASSEFDKSQSALSMALGHDIVGKPVIVDLGKMPHLLVAGTTGSGKSVGINAMILSLLFKSSPDDVRMIMIDPKMLELSVYDDIPHLLTPVITDMKDAANGLRWCVAEMERRYKLMSALGVRNLAGYNKKVRDAKKAGEPIIDPVWQPDPTQLQDDQVAPELAPLPNIVVVVDELADMMMVVGKKVEELIARIAQKARAA